MKHMVIGDVHGCLAELKDLLVKLAPAKDDTVVFVGDLLDRGPDSAGVVRYVRELKDVTNVVLVEGNHEDKHRRYRSHVARNLATGKRNPMKDSNGVLAGTSNGFNDADKAFLDAAVLFHLVPEHDLLVVHGGVPPNVLELPPEGTKASDLSAPERKLYGAFLRVRHVEPGTGKMVAMDKTTEDHPYWADVYDGRFGHVVFGHEPFFLDHSKEFTHATGVDLGCVFGGVLAARVYQEGCPVVDVTVEAHDTYAQRR